MNVSLISMSVSNTYGNLQYISRNDMILLLLNNVRLLECIMKEIKQYDAFDDWPWMYLYPIFNDIYAPYYDIKYIFSIRSDTYTLVNSHLKYILKLTHASPDINMEKIRYGALSGIDLGMVLALRYERHNEEIIMYFNQFKVCVLCVYLSVTVCVCD